MGRQYRYECGERWVCGEPWRQKYNSLLLYCKGKKTQFIQIMAALIESSSDEDMSLADLAKQQQDAPKVVKKEKDVKAKKKKKKKDKKRKKDKKKRKDKKRARDSSSSGGRSASSSKKVKRARTTGGPKKTKAKNLNTTQQLDRAMKAFRWWEAPELPKGQHWTTLEHHGVHFPPAYTPHGIKLVYDGNEVDLTPAQEEIVTMYAAIPLDGPQLGADPKIAKVFNKNFFNDFQKLLGKKHEIKSFDKCNFDKLRSYVNHERDVRKARSKEEKQEEKFDKDALSSKYAYAVVDGNIQKVGNFTIEPPGLFRGRGEHPKTGTLKTNVAPEQVTINIGVNEPVPKCKEPGHAWGTVISDNSVTWLGTYDFFFFIIFFPVR